MMSDVGYSLVVNVEHSKEPGHLQTYVKGWDNLRILENKLKEKS